MDQLRKLFQAYSDKNGFLPSANFFGICKLLNLWPTLISLDKVKRIITKDEKFWPNSKNSRTMKKGTTRSTYFNFKDFIKAFQLMAMPNGDKHTSKDIIDSKIKFFNKLKKLIDRLNARSVANGPNKDNSPYIAEQHAESSHGGNSSSSAALRVKKNLNNSVLDQK